MQTETTMATKLSKQALEQLDSVYVCARANGFSHWQCYSSATMRTLEKRGLVESRLSHSVAGGNMRRTYRLTLAGIKLAESNRAT